MKTDKRLQEVKFSDLSKKYGFESCYIKRECGEPCGWDGLYRIPAYSVLLHENIYTIDGILIANRIN